MGNVWGNAIRLSIFGESHGRAVGMIIDGLPAGTPVDMDTLRRDMLRRAPGQGPLATMRREPDEVEIVSGLLDGKTTGSPLCGIIYNRDHRSGDYDTALRPGHADLTALLKYDGHADMRGGGHFSGRLTAPLVFAGSVAGQLLRAQGIGVYGRIAEIAGITDSRAPEEPSVRAQIAGKALPVWDDAAGAAMKKAILTAKEEGDSVGGVVEVIAFGLPAGLGEPFFHSLESEAAALLFSVPAVKGVEFGSGFELAKMRGSEANDSITCENGRFATTSNHNGGVLGGITNGMPLVVRAAIKPTPSISREQATVTPGGEAVKLAIRGRHDPCIVPRAVPVIEAALNLCILDLWLENRRRIL